MAPTLAETALVVHADMRRVKPTVVAAATSAGEAGGAALGEGVTRGADGKLRDAHGRFVSMGGRSGRGFGAGFESGFGGTLKKVAQVMLSRFALIGAGAAAAAPGVLQLTAALLPAAGAVVGLAPAIAGAVTATQTFKVATFQVSDAVKKGLYGSAKAYQKALEDLPPAQRAVTESLVGLKSVIQSVRQSVGERFFAPMVDDMQPLVNTYVPLFRTEMAALGGQMGLFGSRVLEVARSAPVVATLRESFRSTGGAVTALQGAIQPATDAMVALLRATLPTLPGMAAGFTRVVERVRDFVVHASQSGAVVQVFRDGVETLKTLAHTAGNIGVIFAQVLRSANQQGGSLLVTFDQLTGEIADFATSARGVAGINALLGTMARIGDALRQGLAVALPAVADSFRVLGPAIAGAAGPAVQLVTAFAPLLPLVAGIAAQVLRALTPAIAAVAGYLAQNEWAVKALVGSLVAYRAVMLTSAAITAVQGAGSLLKYLASTKLVTAATKAWAAVQTIMNAVLTANPIGLVVAALAALAGAVYLAWTRSETFRKVVTAAWQGIKAAAQSVANWFMTSALPTLRAVWDGIASGATWLWRTVLQPVFLAWVAYFRNVVAPTVMWLWRNIVAPAFAGIRLAVQVWWAMAQIIFKAAVMYFRTVLAPTFTWLWRNIVVPVFNGIRVQIQTWWNLARAIFTAVIGFIRGTLAPAFTWFWRNIIVPTWNGITGTLSRGWQAIRTGVFDPLRNFIMRTLPDGFRAGTDAIRRAWDGVREAARKPVAFVVNSVINPLLHGLRMVGDFFNVRTPARIPGFARGGLPDRGGRIPGAASTVDNMLAGGPGGILKVATGEFITNALSTSANLPLMRVINDKRGRVTHEDLDPVLDGRARGGPIGDGIGDFFGKVWNGIKGAASMVADPKAALAKVANAAIARIPGGGGIRDMMVSLGRKAIGWVGQWIDSTLGGAAGSAAGIGGGSVLGGYRGMQRLISARFPGLGMISGFRPGSRTLSGRLSYHARGRAVDYPPSRALAAWIRATFGGRTKELITPFQELNLLNGRPHRYTGAVWNQHNFAGGNAHVHWAAALGGLIGRRSGLPGSYPGLGGIAKVARADFGSVTLGRGWNLIENRTGRPEPLQAPSSSGAVEALLRELIDAVRENPAGLAAALSSNQRTMARQVRTGGWR